MAATELSINEKNILNNLFSTMATTLINVGSVGYNQWPAPVFNPWEGDMYAANEIFNRLYSQINKLENKGFSDIQIANLLKAPSRIAQLTWLFSAAEMSELTKQETINLVLKLIHYISCFRREDPFCSDGSNRILDQATINKIIDNQLSQKLSFVNNKDSKTKQLNKLSSILWLYCELLYFCNHGAGHEFHGPYNINKNEVFTVYFLESGFQTLNLTRGFYHF